MVKKVRKGFSLVELLIAVVVLGILGAMLIAAGTAAQNKARVSVASNDIDSVRNAVFTMLTMDTSVQQYSDTTADWSKNIIDKLNAELDETWTWDPIGGTHATKSGPIAQTRTMRDPWNNPYTLYCYTDSCTTSYFNEAGAAFTNPDSSFTLVIVSAGPNGTGVGTGIDGSNGNSGTAPVAGNMVNNTDGVDDIGVIMQLVNGNTLQATFGWSAATYGTLEHVNWYFCGTSPNAPVGKYSEKNASGNVVDYSGPTTGSSIKLHPTLEKLPGATTATKASPFKVDAGGASATS